MTKKELFSFNLRIVIPAFSAVALYIISFFVIILPSLEKRLVDRKKEMIRELTNSVISLLKEYNSEYQSNILSLEEAQRRAIRRIEQIRYGEEGKDYFWITDMEPQMIMHPYRNELEGKDLTHYEDPDGINLFVIARNKIREKGDAYIRYQWQWKDDTTKIVPKLSYCKGFKEWNWIIGTGVYVNDMKKEIREIKFKLIRISIGVVVILTFIIIFMIRQSMNIENERIRAEKKLIASRERYKSQYHNFPKPVYTIKYENNDFIFTNANKAALEDTNSNIKLILGKSIYDIWKEEPRLLSCLENTYNTRKQQETEFLYTYKTTNKTRYISFKFGYIPENQILMYLDDITEKWKAQKDLERSEEKYREIVQNANSAIIKLDLKGNITFFNEYAEQIFGYSNTEIIGKNVIGTILPQDLNSLNKGNPLSSKESLQEMLANIENHSYGENWNLTKNGGKIFMSWRNQPIYDDNIKPVGAICIGSDNTERKLAMDALMESESKFRNLFDNANDAILILDKNMIFADCNKQATNLQGFERDEIIGKTPLDFSPEYQNNGQKSIDIAKKALKLTFEGYPQSFEWTLINKDRSLRYSWITTSLFEYSNETFIQLIVRDITERKELEKRYLKATIDAEENERARFAKELHDGVGPLLSTVKLYFQWLAENDDHSNKQSIVEKGNKNIEEALMALKEISNNLSPHILTNYGLIDALKRFIEKITQVNNFKINFSNNLHHRLKREIEVTLYRVVTELLNNTIKYAQASEVNLKIFFNKEFDSLSLNYSDNGKGFNMEDMLKVRSGQGIFNMKSRISTLGGEIEFKTMEGAGFKANITINQLSSMI